MNEHLQSSSQPVRRWLLRALHYALGLVLVFVAPGGAQDPLMGPQQPVAVQYNPRSPEPGPQFEEDDPVLLAKRMRAINDDRQRRIVSDTARLLKLAGELNAEIAREKPDLLTPDELQKVAEIEKLARSVKEKMTYTEGDNPALSKPISPWFR
jgi:hypothetical protein